MSTLRTGQRSWPATRAVFAAMLAIMIAVGSRSTASAQSYPVKPIHIVVPFAAGGITDVIGRALGQRLAEAWGQQVVIENKPGGGTGQVGTEYVARSAPDGYTLLVTADATFVTSPHTYSKLPYDPINDFVPVTGLGISPQALVVHPSLPVRTLGDLIDYARKKPGELNYGTFGIGSSGHLNIILLEGMTGTKFTPVHYRGAAPAITDLIGGHIQMMIVSIGLVAQPWQSGALNVLGFGSAARIGQYPELCRRWPRAGCLVTKPGPGMDWPHPKARHPRSSPSSTGRLSKSLMTPPFEKNSWRRTSSFLS